MAQSIASVIAGLTAACTSIFTGQTGPDGTPVLVTYGPPGSNQPQSIVAVGMQVRQPVTRPTMGTSRSREKLAEVTVIVSTFVAGGEAVQQLATEKTSALVELLDAYFRTAGQETLGGSCLEAWLSNIDGPTPDVALDPASGSPSGRLADATVTITARIRY